MGIQEIFWGGRFFFGGPNFFLEGVQKRFVVGFNIFFFAVQHFFCLEGVQKSFFLLLRGGVHFFVVPISFLEEVQQIVFGGGPIFFICGQKKNLVGFKQFFWWG